MDDITGRLLNPVVLFTIVAAGVGFGAFLWALELRPVARLYAASVAPGVVFILTILAIRAAQDMPSPVYLVLLTDWLIFSHAGVVTVLVARRWRAR